jgi:hypothetical protein
LDAAESLEAREKMMKDLLEKFEHVRSPVKTAHKFGVEEIIDPRDTRPLACEVSGSVTGACLNAGANLFQHCKWTTHVYEHVLPQLLTVRRSNYGLDSKPSSGRGYRL